MKFLTTIKLFDFLGPEIKFRIDQNEIFKTFFGGILSLISCGIYLAFFFIFGMDFFFKQNPKVLTQLISPVTEEISKFSLDENFHFAFRLCNFQGLTIPINLNSGNIKISYINFVNSLDISTDLEFKVCSDQDFPYKLYVNSSEYFCLDFKNTNVILGGGWENVNLFFGYLDFELTFNKSLFKDYSNSNDIHKNNNDYSNFIKSFWYLEMALPQAVFDPNDYLEPLKLKPIYNWASLIRYSGVVEEIYLRDHRVETDNGILMENIEKTHNIGYNFKTNFNYFINETNMDAVYSGLIYFNKSYNFSMRQYMKLQDLLGNISGFMDIVYFLLSFITYFNSNYNLKKFVVNNLTYIIDKNEISNRNKNDLIKIIGTFEKKNNKRNFNSQSENPKIDKIYLDDFKVLEKTEENNIDKKSNSTKLNYNSNKVLDLSSISDRSEIDQEFKNNQIRNNLQINNFCLKDSKNKIKYENINDHNKNSSHQTSNPEMIKELNLISGSEFNKSNCSSKDENNFEKLKNNIQMKINLCYEITKNKGKWFLEYNFFDYLLKGKLFGIKFNYDKKLSNKKIADSIFDKIFQNLDIIYYFKIMNKFKCIENFIFNEKQKTLYNSVTERQFYLKYNKNDKSLEYIRFNSQKTDEKCMLEHYNNLFEKNCYSVIDEKILEILYEFIK